MANTNAVLSLTAALGGASEGEASLSEFSFSVAEVMGGSSDSALGESTLLDCSLVRGPHSPGGLREPCGDRGVAWTESGHSSPPRGF
jgi:hypothetical protein